MKTINDIKSGKFAGLKTVVIGHLVVNNTPASVSNSGEHTVSIMNNGCLVHETKHTTAFGARAAFALCVKLCKNVSNVR